MALLVGVIWDIFLHLPPLWPPGWLGKVALALVGSVLCWENWEWGDLCVGNTMDGMSWLRDPTEVWKAWGR